MKRHTQHSGERGIFLLHALLYVVVLAAIAHVAFDAFFTLQTGARRVRQAADDVVAAMHAGELWRADVRTASGPVQMPAPDEILIPQTDGDPVRYRLRDSGVYRQERQRGEQIVLRDVDATRFIRDERGPVTACRWELTLQPNGPNPGIQPRFTFIAVPGTMKQ